MPNIYYQRGRRAEYEARDILAGEGWEVYRTAGSHGKADLIGIKGTQHKLVQIKTCMAADLKAYSKKKIQGVELWIKVLNKGWEFIES